MRLGVLPTSSCDNHFLVMCEDAKSREALYLGIIAVLWAALMVVGCRKAPRPPPPVATVPLSVLRTIESSSPAGSEMPEGSDSEI